MRRVVLVDLSCLQEANRTDEKARSLDCADKECLETQRFVKGWLS